MLGHVGLGDDAHEASVLLYDREPAHLVLGHQAERFVQPLPKRWLLQSCAP